MSFTHGVDKMNTATLNRLRALQREPIALATDDPEWRKQRTNLDVVSTQYRLLKRNGS